MHDITILILNYNTSSLIKNLLESLDIFFLKKTILDVHITVIDNNSTDTSVEDLRSTYPDLDLIKNPENIGFGAGNNSGLRTAKSRYILLLNSDTEITTESHLEKLFEYAEKNENVAVITPQVLLDSGELDLACHRGEPTPWASLSYFLGLEKLFPKVLLFSGYHQLYKNLREIHDVDACSGAAFFVRTSAIKKVGYFDEEFFMYGEDLDLCRQFRDAGYRIVYDPSATVIHHKYQSGLKNANQKLAKKTSAYFYSTMVQYYDKYYRKHYPSVVRSALQLFIQMKMKGIV